jgi:hypothetical protein
MTDLIRLPITTLVALAKEKGSNASIVHKKEDLIRVIRRGGDLPDNPVSELRERVRLTLNSNWDQYDGLIDKQCQKCYLSGQTLCHDVRAIGDYRLNIEVVFQALSEKGKRY